jgi:hypothetical protein
MTDASLDDIIVAWALAAVGGDHLVSISGLREGGPPWLVRYEGSGGPGSAVVRAGGFETAGTQKFEVHGMALARAAGVPVPGVIAAHADDKAALLLIEYVDGSSHQPAEPDGPRAYHRAVREPVDAEVLKLITSWITTHWAASPRPAEHKPEPPPHADHV